MGSCGAGGGSTVETVDGEGSVCASTADVVGACAGALEIDAAEAVAPGRRRAALGATFLPVGFLLMKELNPAGFNAGAFSGGADGGCEEPSSADMTARRRGEQRPRRAVKAAWSCVLNCAGGEKNDGSLELQVHESPGLLGKPLD